MEIEKEVGTEKKFRDPCSVFYAQETKSADMTPLRGVRAYNEDFSRVIRIGDALSIELVCGCVDRFSGRSVFSNNRRDILAYSVVKIGEHQEIRLHTDPIKATNEGEITSFQSSFVLTTKQVNFTNCSFTFGVFEISRVFRSEKERALLMDAIQLVSSLGSSSQLTEHGRNAHAKFVHNILETVQPNDHLIYTSTPLNFSFRGEKNTTGNQEEALKPVETYLQEGYYIIFQKPIPSNLANKIGLSLPGLVPRLNVSKHDWRDSPDPEISVKNTTNFGKNHSFLILHVVRDYSKNLNLESKKKDEMQEVF